MSALLDKLAAPSSKVADEKIEVALAIKALEQAVSGFEGTIEAQNVQIQIQNISLDKAQETITFLQTAVEHGNVEPARLTEKLEILQVEYAKMQESNFALTTKVTELQALEAEIDTVLNDLSAEVEQVYTAA